MWDKILCTIQFFKTDKDSSSLPMLENGVCVYIVWDREQGMSFTLKTSKSVAWFCYEDEPNENEFHIVFWNLETRLWSTLEVHERANMVLDSKFMESTSIGEHK